MSKTAEQNAHASLGDLPEALALLRDLAQPFARLPGASIALALFSLPDEADAAEHSAFVRAVRRAMLPCDGLGIYEGWYAWILPGAGLDQAMPLITAAMDAYTLPCTAGVAARTGPDRSALTREALEALALAHSTGTRVQANRGDTAALRNTLVRAHEKRFLFSGGD